jgi:cytochrome P450
MTTTEPAKALTNFDHHGSNLPSDSFNVYAEMRAQCPVAWTEANGGYWVITGHEQVAEASRNYEIFTSEHDASGYDGITIPPQPKKGGLIETDPPAFLPLRRALAPWFSPQAAKDAEPAIVELVDSCIDRVIEAGHCDLIEDIATPIPAIQTMQLLGFPMSEAPWLADLMHRETCTPPNSPDRPKVHEDVMRLHGLLHDWATERRAHPGDDFLSFLATLEIDGRLLPIDEVCGNTFLMLAGGVDTTTGLLSNTFVHLQQDQAARRYLIEDLSRLNLACEEYLRYFTPVQGLARTVTQDCEFAGQQLHKYDRVWISWASANYAGEVFDDPRAIKLDRTPNRHGAFGLGIHRCLGSNIARVVWRVTMERVLTRLPDYVLDIEQAVRYPSIGITNGWQSMPATFTPGLRVGAPDAYGR